MLKSFLPLQREESLTIFMLTKVNPPGKHSRFFIQKNGLQRTAHKTTVTPHETGGNTRMDFIWVNNTGWCCVNNTHLREVRVVQYLESLWFLFFPVPLILYLILNKKWLFQRAYCSFFKPTSGSLYIAGITLLS
jgi:hypothetical protein